MKNYVEIIERNNKVQHELTGLHNAINEVFAWNEAFVIFVHFTEQISDTRLLVVHVLHELKSTASN
jgi:hypothetical protein